mgnify:CR=1 FL=1
MATKTANVLARVEPEVKEEAENIMSQLGIPASVVINMLYKQIILTKGIPFSLNLHHAPKAREDMGNEEFNTIMARGLADAKANRSSPAGDMIADLKRDIKEWTK